MVSACTSALAHGGNDVANCIGPFVIIWILYRVRHAYWFFSNKIGDVVTEKLYQCIYSNINTSVR